MDAIAELPERATNKAPPAHQVGHPIVKRLDALIEAAADDATAEELEAIRSLVWQAEFRLAHLARDAGLYEVICLDTAADRIARGDCPHPYPRMARHFDDLRKLAMGEE